MLNNYNNKKYQHLIEEYLIENLIKLSRVYLLRSCRYFSNDDLFILIKHY